MRIGEVARRSGVSVRMLRHYDSLGLVSPSDRTSAGYREYTEKDLRRILHIEALRSLGLSLAQAGDALDAEHPDSPDSHGPDRHSPDRHGPNTDDADPDVSPQHEPAQVLDTLIARTRERVAAEQELLTRLEDTRDRAPQDWDDVLGTIALLRAVRSDDPGSRHAVALTGHDVPPAALARAALDEDETNIAGALRWAARRDPTGGAAVVQAAAQALADPDPTRRHRAVELLADQLPVDETAQPKPDAMTTSEPGHSAPGHHAIVTLVTTGLADENAEVRAASALALASVPGQLDGLQRQTLTDILLDLIEDGENDVEAAEGLGRLAATEQPTRATASAAVEALLARLRDPEVTAAGRLRLLQAAGELPEPDMRHVLDAHAQTTDREAARILAYLEHRLDAGTQT